MAARKTTKKAAKAPARNAPAKNTPVSAEIEQRFRDLGDWRGEMLSKLRALILDADPEMVEEIKWRKPSNPAGVPIWSHDGIVCTGETYKDHVKLTFARGAALADPKRLFNASLDGNLRRGIDLHQGDRVDAKAFQKLIRDAAALNASDAKKRR